MNRLRFAGRTVARTETLSALQSRGGDGFSPSSRTRSLPVIVDGAPRRAESPLAKVLAFAKVDE